MSSATTDTLQAPAVSARWTPDPRGWALRIGVMAGLLLLIIWATATVPDFWADRIALAAIYAIIGLSLNVVLGYTGQVSLGHHAFVGLAAFTSAYYVTEKAGCSPDVGCETTSLGAFGVGVGLAILSGIVSAGLLGMVALRIKGLYLALITLTYGFVALNSIFEISFLTRGGAGMPAARPGQFSSDQGYAFLCLGLLAIVIFIDWRFLASKVGRAVLAVKESEAVAATYAVNVTAYKVFAFMMSGAFAGLAGALFAHRRGIVVAVDFTFSIALLWVLMVVVGGLGKRVGVVVGSAFFALFPFLITLIGPLDSFIHDTLKRDPEELTLIIGPLLALITIIQFPGGIAEQLSPLTRWLAGEKFSLHPEGKRAHKSPLAKLKGLTSKKRGVAATGADATQPVAARTTAPPPAEAPPAAAATATATEPTSGPETSGPETSGPSPFAPPPEEAAPAGLEGEQEETAGERVESGSEPTTEQPKVSLYTRDYRNESSRENPASTDAPAQSSPGPASGDAREEPAKTIRVTSDPTAAPAPTTEPPATQDRTGGDKANALKDRVRAFLPRRSKSNSDDPDWPDVLKGGGGS